MQEYKLSQDNEARIIHGVKKQANNNNKKKTLTWSTLGVAEDMHTNYIRVYRHLVYNAQQKIIILLLNQNKCCGYSKEPSQWDGSFEHPKHMLEYLQMYMKLKMFIYLILCMYSKIIQTFVETQFSQSKEGRSISTDSPVKVRVVYTSQFSFTTTYPQLCN